MARGEDENLYQSANWTWAPNPAQRPYRYAQLGGVAFQKVQNPEFLDYTNSYLNTRAIDRRTIDPFPDIEKEYSSTGKNDENVKTTKPKKKKKAVKRYVHPVPEKKENSPSFSTNYVNQMNCMAKEIKSNINNGNSMLSSVSKAVYREKRPQYLGMTILIFLVIILIITLFSKK